MSNGSTGGPVPPIDPERLRRVFNEAPAFEPRPIDPAPYRKGATPAAWPTDVAFYYAEGGQPGDVIRAIRCQQCATLGHICRPCRKRLYERRYPCGMRRAFWGWALFIAMLALITAGAVYAPHG
jgi:hypothetical protein